MKWLIKHDGKNRKQRRSQYHTGSRSKPYCKPRRREWKAKTQFLGLQKIEALLQRGIMLNSRKIKPSKISLAVKKMFGFKGAQKDA